MMIHRVAQGGDSSWACIALVGKVLQAWVASHCGSDELGVIAGMKSFRFRLERLAKLRERTREQRKIALAEAIAYRQRVEGQLGQLEDVRSEEKNSLREVLREGSIPVETVIQGQAFDGMLRRFSSQLGQQLEQVEGVVTQRRMHLLDAEKSVRVLERLEERVRAKYEESAARMEREQLDELASVADQRRRLGLDRDV